MTIQITPGDGGKSATGRKVTCLTCKLKKCVGRCRWQTVSAPKAA
jgi:hypothetical protein